MNIGTNELTVCEGNLLIINCLTNQYISISNAWYGRNDTETCLDCADCLRNCYENIIKNLDFYLNGNNNFTLDFNILLLSDPFPGTYKYSNIYFTWSVNNVYETNSAVNRTVKSSVKSTVKSTVKITTKRMVKARKKQQ